MGEKRKGKKSAFVYAANVLILIFLVVFAYLFAVRGMRFFLVPSSSMAPTLNPDDYIVTLNAGEYRPGDIVVVRDFSNGSREYVVKRIVATGGDTVSAEGGALFRNGNYVSEPYVREPMEYSFPPVEVEEGNVFVLGDNRNRSDDSHSDLEGHPVDNVVGRVRLRYFPYHRFGPVGSGRAHFRISEDLAVRVE